VASGIVWRNLPSFTLFGLLIEDSIAALRQGAVGIALRCLNPVVTGFVAFLVPIPVATLAEGAIAVAIGSFLTRIAFLAGEGIVEPIPADRLCTVVIASRVVLETWVAHFTGGRIVDAIAAHWGGAVGVAIGEKRATWFADFARRLVEIPVATFGRSAIMIALEGIVTTAIAVLTSGSICVTISALNKRAIGIAVRRLDAVVTNLAWIDNPVATTRGPHICRVGIGWAHVHHHVRRLGAPPCTGRFARGTPMHLRAGARPDLHVPVDDTPREDAQRAQDRAVAPE